MFKTSSIVLLALTLSACGGGDSSPTIAPPLVTPTPTTPAPVTPVAVSPALSFNPIKLSASFAAGTSQILNATATVTRPADFAGATNVFAYVVDDSGVILPTAQVIQTSTSEYSVRVSTMPTLTLGAHTGNLSLRLCKDSACVAQFPGSPVALPYELTVTPPALPQITASASVPLSATVRQGAASTTASVVSLTAAGRKWTVASSAGWLKTASASGEGSGTVAVTIDATGIAAGSYLADLTFTANDGQSTSLQASLTVLPTAFAITGSQLTFNAVNGAPIPSQALKFTLDNATPSPWSAATDASWLTVDPVSGITPATANLAVNPAAANLASGKYSSVLTLSSPLSKPAPFTVNLNLVAPTLALNTGSMTLGGANGRSFAAAPVKLTLNTDVNAWPWTLSALPAWLQSSAASGTVNQTGATVNLTPVASGAAVGTSTSTLSFSARVNGDTVVSNVPVTINKDVRKLVVDETAVAFTSTPGLSRLSRTIRVRDNFGIDGAWSAASDQPWLSVLASGRTANDAGTLALSADPASLPADRISYATITLTPESGVAAPEKIRVAIWKGSTTPSAAIRVATRYTNLVLDPLRPLAYVNAGGTAIDIYNVYTGARTGSIAGAAAAAGAMAVSPNGDTLYIFDTANRAIGTVNLDTLVKGIGWTMPGTSGPATADSRLIVMRPNGVEVVVTNVHGSYLAATGAQISTLTFSGDIAASGDSRRLYNSNMSGYNVDYAAVNGGTLFLNRIQPAGYSYANGSTVSLNLDGSRAYVSGSNYPPRCTAFSGDDASELGGLPGPTDSSPNNVKVGTDGRIFCATTSYSGTADLFINRADGTLLASVRVNNQFHYMLSRQMGVSGDAMVVVALTDDPTLVFYPVGR